MFTKSRLRIKVSWLIKTYLTKSNQSTLQTILQTSVKAQARALVLCVKNLRVRQRKVSLCLQTVSEQWGNTSSLFGAKFLISLQGCCHVGRVGGTSAVVIFGPAVNIGQRAGAAPCLDLVGGTAGLHLPCAVTVPKAWAEPRGSCSADGISVQGSCFAGRNVLGRQERTRVRLESTGAALWWKGGKLKALKG